MASERQWVEVVVRAPVQADEVAGWLADTDLAGAWEDAEGLRLYWADAHWKPETEDAIRQAVRLAGMSSDRPDIAVRRIADEDWNARWAQSVRPIRIGRRIVISPTWETAVGQPGEVVLRLDPKQAFGTGHHATTRMLLEWLEGAIAGGERVLDIGTGSGILAMTALRLGARAALAVDHDPVAIECAAASAADNGFGQELDLHVADLGDLRGPAAYRADLVLANLDTRTFTTHAERFRPWLEAGARLFLSGMLAEDREAIEAAFARISGAVARCERREGWLAMELRRPEGREGAN